MEPANFVSPWESVDQPMVVDSDGDTNTYAIQAVDEATVVVLEFFNSRNILRRDPFSLPGKGDVSRDLRISSVCLFSPYCFRNLMPLLFLGVEAKRQEKFFRLPNHLGQDMDSQTIPVSTNLIPDF